jgi:hypothetical protein
MKHERQHFMHFKPRLGGRYAIALSAVSPLAAAEGEDAAGNALWLYALPDWAAFALSVTLFVGLALSLTWLLRRRRQAEGEGLDVRVNYYATGAGIAVGALVGLLVADMKQTYLFEAINQLPPSAAGKPAVPPGLAKKLFQDAAAEVPSQLKSVPHVKEGRSRAVQVDTDALNQDRIELDLFDDLTLIIVKDRIVQDENGTSWIGHAEGYDGSEVILSARGRVLMGTINLGEDAYDIVYAGNGVHVVRQTDPNAEAPHSEPIPVSEADMAADAVASGTATAPATSGDATGATVDAMVVYTTNAKNNAGGDAGIQAKIMNAVAAANQAYINSQIGMQIRLVHMEEISYAQTGNMSTSLTDLMGTSDGKMDNVHTLRNQYGADQVVLITSESNYCGIAYQMQSLGTGFAPYAFAAVHDDSVYSCLGNQTMAHEMGHNQGNAHNVESSSGYPGIAPYSYGYRVCGSFRTVMSYVCSGETRISNFANPNVLYNGQPTGIAGAADTVSSMNQAAATVANFRATAATSAPNAPSNLAAASASSSAINLSWTDNASDEAGVKVQRSTDGVNWSEIASLGAGAASFSSTGLSAGTSYSYRVYAYNGVGNSPASNVATAATIAAPVDTTPPTASIGNPANGAKVSGTSVKIVATASDNVGVKSLALLIDGKQVSSTTATSLSYNWSIRKVASGAHSIGATATDAAGNKTSVAISVTK